VWLRPFTGQMMDRLVGSLRGSRATFLTIFVNFLSYTLFSSSLSFSFLLDHVSMLCKSRRYCYRLLSHHSFSAALHHRPLAIAHFHTTSNMAMPEVTNRVPSRSPSPPPKRARIDNPTLGTASIPILPPSAPAHTATPADNEASSSTVAPTSSSLIEQVETEMNLPLEYPPTEFAGRRQIVYEDKLVLAPMVRTGSCKSMLRALGVRFLVEAEGADTDLVFGVLHGGPDIVSGCLGVCGNT
jgi:hypothetical protein